ncbi:MAG TPA: GNAT family N-acetyltransferase [Ktedonobacterales bacterium]
MRHAFTSRQYAGEDDLLQMQGLLMDARSRTNDWRYWHIGDLMWAFFLVTRRLNLQDHIRLWHDERGVLAGFALLGEDPAFECQVLPDYAWSGIEIEALAWAEARRAELAKRDAQRWGGAFVWGARQDDTRRIAFLEQHGFRHGEHIEVNLLRTLGEPVPDAAIPNGYQIRAVAESGETVQRADVEREVWQPYSNISGEDYAHLMRLPGYHRELDVVAVTPEGVIVAYVNGWIDPVNQIGDFGPVGAREAYRRRRLTHAVLAEDLRRMRALGMNRVCVSTGESNTPALRLYESLGFAVANQYHDYVKSA